MKISDLFNKELQVIVHGITGEAGTLHTGHMIDYGTNIVAGVTPGKGGEWIHGKPVFDTVRAAVNATNANTSIIMAPREQAADAIYEAIAADIRLIVCVTAGIPLRDMIRLYHYVQLHPAYLFGPNSIGLLQPGTFKLGVFPPNIERPGGVSIVTRSGALTYEVLDILSKAGIGQRVIVGIGGDLIPGMEFSEVLGMLEEDVETEQIVLIGDGGSSDEIAMADYINAHCIKRFVALIPGRSIPVDRYDGMIYTTDEPNNTGAKTKIAALRRAGVMIADSPEAIPDLLR